MRSDRAREGREEREKKKSWSGSHNALPSGPPPAGRSSPRCLAVTLDRPRWTARHSSAAWWTATAPPGSGSRQESPVPYSSPSWRMAAGSGPRRTAATPPLLNGRQPPLQHLGGQQRARPSPRQLTPAHRLERPWRRKLPAMLDGTVDSQQRQGLFDSAFLLLPGFRHQCNGVCCYGKKEAGTGEHSNIFNQNKTNTK